MIKRVMLLLALASGVPAYADMYFDVQSGMCKTYPESKDIDQYEYHQLAKALFFDLKDIRSKGDYNDTCVWMFARINAIKKAQSMNSKASSRFIEDISKMPTMYAFYAVLGF